MVVGWLMLKGVEECRRLPKFVELLRGPAQTVGAMAKSERRTEVAQEWITQTRKRLAQRRGGKPATKAGQLRALWPEIRAAIAEGQSLANICQWLREEAGIEISVQSLGSYLTRIRRKEPADPVAPAVLSAPKPTRRAPHPRKELPENRDRVNRFDYPPGPPDENKLI